MMYVNRMPRNRLPRVMKQYSPSGRRNHGRPLKRLLDAWDRNGSTSGPTPWKIDDDIWYDTCMIWYDIYDMINIIYILCMIWSVAYRGGLGGLGYSNPRPSEIPMISVESSIAWARRTGVSISFCSSLCSHTVVIY